ncbi:MAG: hypothetical protein Q4F49_09920 [Pseudoxanthomonas suwonensis]|nr:hypothetical protein [Pseudoxanthomonas suwonensis]
MPDPHLIAQRLGDQRLDGAELDWAAYAVTRALATLDPAPAWARATELPRPQLPPTLHRLLTHASPACGLIIWASTSPRTRLTSTIAAALCVHAWHCPELYATGDPALASLRYEAGLSLRRLSERGATLPIAPGLWDGPPGGARFRAEAVLAAAITGLRAWATHHDGDRALATIATYARRCAGFLELRQVPQLAPAPLPPLRARPAAQAVHEATATEALAEALRPALRATAIHRDGEVIASVGIARATLPGAEQAQTRPMRLAMGALQWRAARQGAHAGRVARAHAVTDGALADLGQALAGAAPATRALLLGSLLAGVPVTAVARWRVVETVGALLPGEAGLLRNPLALCVPAKLSAALPPPNAKHTSEDVARHVVLPLPQTVPGAVALRVQADSRVGDAFATRADVRRAIAWLRDHACDSGSALTPRRLARVLAHALHVTGAGPAESALIRGTDLSYSRAPAHYYGTTMVAIARWHQPAIDWIARRLGHGIGPASVIPFPGWVGMRRTPVGRTRDLYLARLRRMLRARPGARAPLETVITYHVQIQALVHDLALWLTGARPHAGSLDALLSAEDHLIIEDKARAGAEGRSSARLVPVSAALRQLIDAWAEHRTWLSRRLRGRRLPAPWVTVLPDRSVRAATLRELRAPLPPSGMPANAGRARFASLLADRQVPGEIRCALLGHWLLGAEPGAPMQARAMAEAPAQALDSLDTLAAGMALPRVRRSAP